MNRSEARPRLGQLKRRIAELTAEHTGRSVE
jgi:hypothetical protein